ncbi:MAG TPA: MBL fold metallo-hydrolase, partial [Rhodothermales bacterium]
MQVTLLGTGTSTGVPVIGCRCRVCTSEDPRDRRTRCSALIETNGLTVVIDTGPDFRNQALRHDLREVDAVLFTHHHADHIVGMDDLRPFFFGNDRRLPCYAHPHTADVIANTFPYIFVDGSYPGVPNLIMLSVEGPFEVHSRYGRGTTLPVEPVTVYHGNLAMYGYRVGGFAYLTDTSRIPDESFDQLEGLDVLVLDALRFEPHPTHFSFDEAIEAARRIAARET